MCDVDCLRELVGSTCQEPGCTSPVTLSSRVVGCTVILTWVCAQKHKRTWSSSTHLKAKHGYPFFVNNFIMAVAIPLTGNHYSRFSLLCKCLGLNHISRATYQRLQRLYVCPVVDKKWEEIQNAIISEFQGNGVVVAGDGRMDSPGHSAQYCVYSVMEHDSSKLMDVQVSPVFFRLSIAINA